MNRIAKLFLPATLLLLVCLVGFSPAQQDSRSEMSGKAQGKAREAENAPDGLTQKQEDKVRQEFLKRMENDKEEYLVKLTKQLNVLKDQKRRVQDTQMALRDDIFKRCEMSPENVLPSLLNMERELLSNKIERNVKEISQDEMSEQIAQASSNAERNINNDEVLKNLTAIVDTYVRGLQSWKNVNTQDAVTNREIRKVETDLAEAKIRLEMRKEELIKGSGDSGIAKLNLLMRENALSLAQTKVRCATLTDMCNRLREARYLVDRYNEITESELPRINRSIDRVTELLLKEGIAPEM
jgi:hypothetical protein